MLADSHSLKLSSFSYQQQHQAFVQHATQQLALLVKQKQQIEQQALKAALVAQQKLSAPQPLLPELTGGSNNGLAQVNALLNTSRGNNDRDGSLPSLLEQNINFTLLSGALQNLQTINNQAQNINNNNSNNRDSNDSRNSSLGGDDRDRRGNYAVTYSANTFKSLTNFCYLFVAIQQLW